MLNLNMSKITLQPHIKCRPGDIADAVLLPGDPDRISLITRYWDKAEKVADNRGLPVWTGSYKGVPISVAATGMGCPSAAIVVEELANIGAKFFIRVGTCGALNDRIKPGDLIIPTAAIRGDGTTKEYIAPEFPALADPDLVNALQNAAQQKKYQYWKGINRTHDAFYEHTNTMLRLAEIFEDKRMAKWDYPLLSSEMECSAIFLVSLLRGIKAGAVLAVVTTEPLNLIRQNPDLIYEIIETPDANEGIEKAIQVALDAVVNLLT